MSANILIKVVMLIGLSALIAAFTFLNIGSPNSPKKRQNSVNRITEHYEKLLKLESLDTNAYPPVSAWRFAKIGTAGAYLYQKYFDQLDFDRFELLLHTLYDQIWNSSVTANNSSNLMSWQPLDLGFGQMNKGFSSDDELIFCDVIDYVETSFVSGNSISDLDNWKVPVAYLFEHEHPILPYWGNRPTQIIDDNTVKFKQPYSGKKSFEDGIFQDALQIFSHSSDLSSEDKWIAEFWSDDVRGLTFSPVGRWFSIANQIIRKENTEIKDVISIYFKLGLSLYDSGIVCWKAKYHYNLQRPSAFIQNHFSKQWQPFHDDPSFPAYPSGHAVFGAVAVQILEHFYGKYYAFTDRSHLGRIEFLGKERSFSNLADMAKENAYSRIVLGVHFNEDCSEGLRIGKIIGNKFIETSDGKLLEKLHLTTEKEVKNSLVHEFGLN